MNPSWAVAVDGSLWDPGGAYALPGPGDLPVTSCLRRICIKKTMLFGPAAMSDIFHEPGKHIE